MRLVRPVEPAACVPAYPTPLPPSLTLPTSFSCAAEVPEPVNVAAVQAELRAEKPDVVAAIEAAQAGQAEGSEDAPAGVAAGRREEVEVTFLGTGAAVPSKYRNVTGIHVNLFDRGGLLMDCGEAWAAAVPGDTRWMVGQLPALHQQKL